MKRQNLALVSTPEFNPAIMANGDVKRVQWIQLARLSHESREKVWGYLRTHKPEVAEKLEQTSRDPQIQQLLSSFASSITIQKDWLPPAILNSLSYH